MAKAKAKSKPLAKSKLGCKCADLIDVELKKRGLALVRSFMFDPTVPSAGLGGIQMAVRKRSDAPRGTKIPVIACTFCPSCGVRLIPEKKAKPSGKKA